MYTRIIKIINPTGLHTRPGTRFVKEARKYSSSILISKGEKTADAKNLIKVLKIGISKEIGLNQELVTCLKVEQAK